MGAVVAGVGKGGVRCLDYGDVSCHCGSGGTSLWVGNMGCVPTHWEDTKQPPPLGGMHTDSNESKEEAG